MAQLIDKEPEELENGEEFTTLEDTPEEEALNEELTLEQEEDDHIPEKYQGKDIKDIVQMHQEAEKLLGRQSSEVGELRKIVDDFIRSQSQQAASPQQETVEEIDFFEDPSRAMALAIENHPSVRQATEASLVMKQQNILAKLQTDHPDFVEIVSDPKFQEWKETTSVRRDLYERADKQFDYEAANELLVLWKERQGMVQETAKVQEQDRKRQLKAASTGSTRGSSEAPSRKIYRRADIIKLMQTDPKRYTQLSDEIMAAYAEGRVK